MPSCVYQNIVTQRNGLLIFAVKLPFRTGVMYNVFNSNSCDPYACGENHVLGQPRLVTQFSHIVK